MPVRSLRASFCPTASMRPRSGERGNLFGNPRARRDFLASMRPRSGERGNERFRDRYSPPGWASMRPRSGERGNSRRLNCMTVKEQPQSMRVVAFMTARLASPSMSFKIDLIENDHFPSREHPTGFSRRHAARNAHRVTNTEYSFSSPSSVFASSRAWISRRRR